ncbi:hypothetical protein [Pseudomonas sp. EggHat1]|uniref:hypothetical protein n=1 Tax=Pseudomonas sp. EggHat1 TaxID=2761624 RepID=UPI00186660BF|nr:hypothetical protein [Pseudomonas sp. EggHat1]
MPAGLLITGRRLCLPGAYRKQRQKSLKKPDQIETRVAGAEHVLARRDVAGWSLHRSTLRLLAPEVTRFGGRSAVLPGAPLDHLIRFFIENLSLFCEQFHSDHGASLINA